MNTSQIIQHAISARAFLERARDQLAQFDQNENAVSIFYAALELRFGIEARLNEYLNPLLKEMGKDSKHETEYVASKLLKHLLRLSPNADQAVQMRFTQVDTGHQTGLEFTPVTPHLASLHGQLGECLHFKFFTINENWFLKTKSSSIPNRTLLKVRDLLQETVDELTVATRGSLLGHPRFTALVQEVIQDET